MSKGSLQCSGSPLFLKSKYNSGYSLVLTRKQQDQAEKYEKAECTSNKTQQLIDLVQRVVPSAQLNSNINSEITFLLSIEHISLFPRLFDYLKDKLNLVNVGISAATVEQVFLK